MVFAHTVKSRPLLLTDGMIALVCGKNGAKSARLARKKWWSQPTWAGQWRVLFTLPAFGAEEAMTKARPDRSVVLATLPPFGNDRFLDRRLALTGQEQSLPAREPQTAKNLTLTFGTQSKNSHCLDKADCLLMTYGAV